MGVLARIGVQMVVSSRKCRLKVPKGFGIVGVSVQRKSTQKSSTKMKQSRNPQRRGKVTFGQTARTIPVQRARQAACPLPVVDDRGFRVCAPPRKGATELPRCVFALSPCGCRADRAQLAARCNDAAMWQRVLRGRHILDRPAACVL